MSASFRILFILFATMLTITFTLGKPSVRNPRISSSKWLNWGVLATVKVCHDVSSPLKTGPVLIVCRQACGSGRMATSVNRPRLPFTVTFLQVEFACLDRSAFTRRVASAPFHSVAVLEYRDELYYRDKVCRLHFSKNIRLEEKIWLYFRSTVSSMYTTFE